MWIRFILALILIKLSEEKCTKLRILPFGKSLYLSCTNITPNAAFSEDVFSKMDSSVERLFVTNSSLPELTQEMFENMTFKNITIKSNVEIIQSETFQHLNVNILVLDYNDIKKIKDNSFSSSFIQTLSLQNNSLSEIKVNNFQGLSGLKKLNLKYNAITDIEEDSFNSLTSLEQLDLSFNKLVELHFELFQLTTSLQILYLNDNLLKTLSDHIFSQCKALKKIYIDNNFLTLIDARQYPKSLVSISVSNNQLMLVDFSNLTFLETLNLNSNNLKSVADSLSNSTSLKFLYLNYNSFGPFIDTKIFYPLERLTVLDLDGNSLEKIDLKSLNMSFLYTVSVAANNLTSLDFSNVATSFTTLLLTRNSLKDIVNISKARLRNLRTLDISYNNFEEIGFDMFGNLTKLAQLFLQHNSIRFLQLGCFRNLLQLRKLDLSHNRITEIEVGLFTGLNLVISLDISYNNLSHLDENIFYGMRQLTFLNISYNHLNAVDIKKIQLHTYWIKDIVLIGNNWSCQTLIDSFKRNVYMSHGPFYNVTNVFGIPCTNDDNMPTNLTWDSVNFTKYLDSIEEYGNQVSWNLTVITAVLISLLILMCLVLLFCLKLTFPKCCPCYAAAGQFVYERHREEQEIQMM